MRRKPLFKCLQPLKNNPCMKGIAWGIQPTARCQLETWPASWLSLFCSSLQIRSVASKGRTHPRPGCFQTERVSFYPSNSGRVAGCALLVWGVSSVNYQRREGKRTALMRLVSNPHLDQNGKLGSGLRNRHRLTRRLATEAVSNCVLRLPSGSEAPERDRFPFDLGNLSAPALRLGSGSPESEHESEKTKVRKVLGIRALEASKTGGFQEG